MKVIIFSLLSLSVSGVASANMTTLKAGQSVILCNKYLDNYSAVKASSEDLNSMITQSSVIVNGKGSDQFVVNAPFSVSAPSMNQIPVEHGSGLDQMVALCVTLTKN